LSPLRNQVTVLPVNGASKSVAANDVTVYPWHSLVPFLTTNVVSTNSVVDKKSDDTDQDDKEDGGQGGGTDRNHEAPAQGQSSTRRQENRSSGGGGTNNNVEAKDADLPMTDDEVFDDGEDFLLSPSPTTPTEKGRRSKDRIRRPMNAFMVGSVSLAQLY
jgi:hypothetical protein